LNTVKINQRRGLKQQPAFVLFQPLRQKNLLKPLLFLAFLKSICEQTGMGAGDSDYFISLLEGPLFLFFDLLNLPCAPYAVPPVAFCPGRAVTHADGDQVLVDT